MFLDGKQITALYNTVVKSESGALPSPSVSRSLKVRKQKARERWKRKIGLTAWLIAIFPFFNAGAQKIQFSALFNQKAVSS
jgi:hypothetical protein